MGLTNAAANANSSAMDKIEQVINTTFRLKRCTNTTIGNNRPIGLEVSQDRRPPATENATKMAMRGKAIFFVIASSFVMISAVLSITRSGGRELIYLAPR